jgi:hypothetical protein
MRRATERGIDEDVRYLDVFERQDERWVAIASVLTPVEDGAKAAAEEGTDK